ncbi:TetR/AcrR family transcriptional regulator [Paraliomyxa miuraensis]|uniref:TetR/AcrR family transcriptional regulator n=1 Tax=Paraliomyxa miuraensis TaxID=376150 RepID=UPI0022573458|nr:TetR/AcrR family transcriptional regulator [Paraliomyxa miuraensis]MCX4242106.1 TetR/AcrR family transcriptional regulator [Paraliomyxa miuraensis]
MGRPLASANAIATPERVLAAAELAFAAVGYGAAKLADIARRAGIGRPSLLYHFGSKEALYARTVERCFGRLRDALVESMTAEGKLSQRIDRTVARYVEFLDAEPQLARIVLRELLDGKGPGRQILLRQVVPLLHVLERFIREQGGREQDGAALRPNVPIRAALLQVGSDALLRAAAGPLRRPLWGSEDHTAALAQLLLLRDPVDHAHRAITTAADGTAG